MKNTPVTDTRNTDTVTIPRAEYEEYLELKKQNAWLLEQLRVLWNQQFGASSEKATEEVYARLSLLFDEAEVYASETKERPSVQVRSHARKQRSGSVRDILPEDIEVVETEHSLSEGERQCPQCGEVMESIGTEVRETLEFIPAKAVLHRDIYHTYACDNCKKNDISTPVMQTPKEPALIPGGYASAEAVAHIAVQKFVMSSPLYRQGVMVSRQTMSNWLLRCADDCRI